MVCVCVCGGGVLTHSGRSLAHMGLWPDSEDCVWQSDNHINDQFITDCHGRGEKEKQGFPKKVLRRLTSCQECRRLLTSSCWLPTSDSDWAREDNGLVSSEQELLWRWLLFLSNSLTDKCLKKKNVAKENVMTVSIISIRIWSFNKRSPEWQLTPPNFGHFTAHTWFNGGTL